MKKLTKKIVSMIMVLTLFIVNLNLVLATTTDEVTSELPLELTIEDQAFQDEYDQMVEDELNSGGKLRSIDGMLLTSQQWLNATYSGRTGYVAVPEDGKSRRSTVNGLIRALQIELGITATAPNFGTGTITRFNAQYPNGVVQQEYPSDQESNVYGIIQCALWTKGYSVGSGNITKHFYDGTGNAVKNLKEDMGFNDSDSTVTLNVMKGLLSMDYYVTLSGGDEQIRQIQQELNRTYPTYLGIIPCDGIYTRNMNKALIIVLQAIEGYKPEMATGNFGDGTKAKLPIDFNLNASWITQLDIYYKCIKLIQYCLCANGYGDSVNLSNINWNQDLSNVISQFQSDLCLKVTGLMNVDTWMSLLLSKGNTDRAAIACDTRFEMTDDRLEYLKNNGYEVVGRYLTGSSKGLKDDEPQRILDTGLSFFPIFQETLYTDTISKYNYELGVSDANKAITRASELYIPNDNIIYFAIDFDPVDSEIQQYVIPYFRAISENIGNYKVGIYGTRNVCTKVMNLGYAETCFVSDMSTGYSGNMGFKIPNDWNLDQFHEYSVTTTSGTWDIDKVAYSENFTVVTGLTRYNLVEALEVLGENETNEFAIPQGAKRLRYTIEIDANEPKTYVESKLYKRAIEIGIDEWRFVVNSHGSTEVHTSPIISPGWINISDKMGYKIGFQCKDLTYGDGECYLNVYLEYEY